MVEELNLTMPVGDTGEMFPFEILLLKKYVVKEEYSQGFSAIKTTRMEFR